jgi:hypothetical protein
MRLSDALDASVAPRLLDTGGGVLGRVLTSDSEELAEDPEEEDEDEVESARLWRAIVVGDEDRIWAYDVNVVYLFVCISN